MDALAQRGAVPFEIPILEQDFLEHYLTLLFWGWTQARFTLPLLSR